MGDVIPFPTACRECFPAGTKTTVEGGQWCPHRGWHDVDTTQAAPAPAQLERQWLTVAETAKVVRVALKREFPGVKFSVRSDRYSGGASIDVRWTDGPTSSAVDAVVGDYAGGRFDGMEDLKYHAEHWLTPDGIATVHRVYGHSHDNETLTPDRPDGAVLVHFGADFIFTNRNVSAEYADAVADVHVHQQENGTYDFCGGCGQRSDLHFWACVPDSAGGHLVFGCTKHCAGVVAANRGCTPELAALQ